MVSVQTKSSKRQDLYSYQVDKLASSHKSMWQHMNLFIQNLSKISFLSMFQPVFLKFVLTLIKVQVLNVQVQRFWKYFTLFSNFHVKFSFCTQITKKSNLKAHKCQLSLLKTMDRDLSYNLIKLTMIWLTFSPSSSQYKSSGFRYHHFSFNLKI